MNETMTPEGSNRIKTKEDALIAAAAAIKVHGIPPERLDEARAFIQDAMEAVDAICTRIGRDLELRDEPLWRANATAALRAKMRVRQRLQVLFGDVNRRVREERNRIAMERDATRERRFIRLVHARLGAEAFRELWRQVDTEDSRPRED